MQQHQIDTMNSHFWDELCGSSAARVLGITSASSESVGKFDSWYMNMYPYLEEYLEDDQLIGRNVLEVGLGYGTLGQRLASVGVNYHGLDIAEGPVRMMQDRLRWIGRADLVNQVQQGSILSSTIPESSMDYVYAIGCLHHTGNLAAGVSEVYRVLSKDGRAIVMLYNAYSYRRVVVAPVLMLREFGLRLSRRAAERGRFMRSLYDTNSEGEAAPHTDYTSVFQIKGLFRQFSRVKVDIRNFDNYRYLKRAHALNSIARVLGLDLYIVAEK